MISVRYCLGIGVVVGLLLSGCTKKGDPISAADTADKQKGIKPPGIAETRAIAEKVSSTASRS